MNQLRVGLIGVDYGHAFGTLRSLRECWLGSLIAAAVEDKPGLMARRKRLLEETGLKKIYNDYIEMLEKESLDAILNYSDYVLRAPATKAAAEHGLHVMTEKPMAYSLEDAEAMVRATDKNNVKLMCNWGIAWSPAYKKIHELVNDFAVGNVFHMRHRRGHAGPRKENLVELYDFQWMGTKEGGGAYMDFGCYGVAFARWLMGIPKEVFGTTGNFVKSFLTGNDNGILLLIYDMGTAVLEGTWSQIGRIPRSYWDLQVFGEKGTILMDNKNQVKIHTEKKPEGEIVDLSEPSKGERNAVEYFLTCIKEDKPIEGLCSPGYSRDTQEILEAGIISSKTKKSVKIPIH